MDACEFVWYDRASAAAGPAPRGPSARDAPPGPPEGRGFTMNGLDVLVCDDNVTGAEALALFLRAARHAVRVAHTGREALAAAREQPPEVVFLDLTLEREMDGCEVARRLRGELGLADAVLVAVTGDGHDDARRRTREAGFDLHLVKPVEPSALLDALQRARRNPPDPAPPP
jgi:CheY-like chemotaxis protein